MVPKYFGPCIKDEIQSRFDEHAEKHLDGKKSPVIEITEDMMDQIIKPPPPTIHWEFESPEVMKLMEWVNYTDTFTFNCTIRDSKVVVTIPSLPDDQKIITLEEERFFKIILFDFQQMIVNRLSNQDRPVNTLNGARKNLKEWIPSTLIYLLTY